MLKHTALYAQHLQQNALMVDFAGWEMPLHYGSQIEEHHFVRQDAGMFDVSHMAVIDIKGKEAQSFLRYVLANNIDKLKTPGSALYTCMLNEQGGVKDDLIAYFVQPEFYRLVVNAATAEKDLEWLLLQAKNKDLTIARQPQLSILAVQGPKARQKVAAALPSLQEKINALKPFHFFIEQDYFMARTGYTGEDGLEIILPHEKIESLWQSLLENQVHPVGLGARDTLRLEAGLNLYGQDMDETVSPLESNLTWTVAFEPENRDFIGRAALLQQKTQGTAAKLTGLKLIDKGILRHHQTIWKEGKQLGIITSGSFSPSLKQSIALARVSFDANNGCTVDIRGKQLKAEIIDPPFISRSKKA